MSKDLRGERYRIPGTSDSRAQTHKPTLPLSQLNETRELDTKQCSVRLYSSPTPLPFRVSRALVHKVDRHKSMVSVRAALPSKVWA